MKKWICLAAAAAIALPFAAHAQTSYVTMTSKSKDNVEWKNKVGQRISLETELAASLKPIEQDNMIDLGIPEEEKNNWFRFRALNLNYLYCHRSQLGKFAELLEGDRVVIDCVVERLYTRGPGTNSQPMLIVEDIRRSVMDVENEFAEKNPETEQPYEKPRQPMLEFVR